MAMLTKRENLMACMSGEKPEHFVNQFEALGFLMGSPLMARDRKGFGPGSEYVNGWGVTIRWVPGTPGPFPVHDDAHKVLKDITAWKDVVRAPSLDFTEEDWAPYAARAAQVDSRELLPTMTVAPGIFEQLHYLMGMDDCMINFYLEPEAIKELIDYITDFELRYAEQLCKYIKPEAILHHDDWGSQRSTFLSPEMFAEFLVPAYKKVYGYYKDHGVKFVMHHSDSYAETLVPYMIDMGIDVWQGILSSNDIPACIQKYGGKISFMGGINNGIVDVENWSRELIRAEVERMCTACGPNYFIPSMTAGGPASNYPGVYKTVTEEIDRMSKLLLGA